MSLAVPPLCVGRRFPLLPGVQGFADFSEDGCYRYSLERIWNPRLPVLVCIGMNPSSAGARADDGTIRLLIGLASRNHYGMLVMLNSAAIIGTDSAPVWKQPDPIGPLNDQVITDTLRSFDVDGNAVMACWGVIPGERHAALLRMLASAPNLRRLCLGMTGGGFPRHPLRTKLVLQDFVCGGRDGS